MPLSFRLNKESNESINAEVESSNLTNYLKSNHKIVKTVSKSNEQHESSQIDDGIDSDNSVGIINDICKKSWTENECLILAYLVEKIGKEWKFIFKNYGTYFPHRTESSLMLKYNGLQKNDSIEKLKQQFDHVKNIKILKKGKTKTIKWTHEETTYLVLGIMRFGKKWSRILRVHKKHFNPERQTIDLYSKYLNLKKKPNKLKYFKNHAKSLNIKIKKELES